ncbi:MAG TPA: cation-translocating P-type ATPase [Bacteroidia bacterium]|nr:cation-translocating P-type ATPase [Bacteroidia bacterium]
MAEKTHLQVEGMTCTNCALGVTRFLEKQGLKDVKVNFSTGDVYFEEVVPADMGAIKKGITGLGYDVVEAGHHHADGHDHSHMHEGSGSFTLEKKFIFSLVFTIPLLAHMLFANSILHDARVQLVLCLPVFVIGLLHFGKSSWSSLKSGILNMDVLIVLGSVAAFVYSIAGMVLYSGTAAAGNFLFFETTATIITLVLLGNVIEKRSVKQTTSAIRELTALQPVTAVKITILENNSEAFNEVAASEIKKGDAVLINNGSVVPVDGTVYWGSATLDESALTGESLPAERTNGDAVLAGSVVVNGTLKVVTEKPTGHTVLASILDLVKEAQMTKPAIQKLGDRISARFVPAVILISVGTFLTGFFLFNVPSTTALLSAIAVLVISCPCAMGLATPTAVAVGLGKAAKKGILIKGGDTLERFAGIKTVVLDKTGTLTTGTFRVTSFKTTGIINEQEVINALVSLEQHSDHPLARSVVSSMGSKTSGWLAFDAINEVKGMGISATDNQGNNWKSGSYSSHIDLKPEPGHTIYFSMNGKMAAYLDLSDDIREGAAEMVRDLYAMGIEPVMLSGDNEIRCKAVADATGIKKVYSGMLPDQKTATIRKLKESGNVIMVGDGINDAPSLSVADVGISFGQATHIAMNAAQVIILDSSNLKKITEAITIGKLTLKTIRQNLFWAFFYNVVAIPVAAFGLLSPMIAALSMAFSDVVVIGNSLRLKLTKH